MQSQLLNGHSVSVFCAANGLLTRNTAILNKLVAMEETWW